MAPYEQFIMGLHCLVMLLCPNTKHKYGLLNSTGLGGSVGCKSDPTSDQESQVQSQLGLATFMEINHEIFSMIILSLLLIQERQLSFSGQRRCTSTG